MGRFSDRISQYPGRIKLTKVADNGNGTIYDCVAAEGMVTNVGTPLNAETLNALDDELSGKKIYRHSIRFACGNIGTVQVVGGMEIYTATATAITTKAALAAALGISADTGYPVSGFNSDGNNAVLVTGAVIGAANIYLRGIYFGYSSGNGSIKSVNAQVSNIYDTVQQVI